MKNNITRFFVLGSAMTLLALTGCKKKEGCTDPNALNYDPDAEKDNGSCIAKVPGCTDPNAYNYDANANFDDGSCGQGEIFGCTDPTSIFYNANAHTDDGSCEWPTQVQVPILYKHTGESCYYCGDWGWAGFKNLANNNKGNIMAWSNYAGPFSSGFFKNQELGSKTTADDMEDRWSNGAGQPNFVVNGNNKGTSAANAQSDITASLSTSPDVAGIFKAEIDGDQLTLTAQVKAFNAHSQDIYVAAYVIEDGAVGPQSGPAGSSGNPAHFMVMRGSMSTSTWGELVLPSPAPGDMGEHTFTVALPSSYDKDNLYYGIIIYSKWGSSYRYENAYTNWQ